MKSCETTCTVKKSKAVVFPKRCVAASADSNGIKFPVPSCSFPFESRRAEQHKNVCHLLRRNERKEMVRDGRKRLGVFPGAVLVCTNPVHVVPQLSGYVFVR